MPEHPSTPSRHRRIVVAGLGLVTPLGQTAWQSFAALLAGRSIDQRTAELPDHTDPLHLVRAVGAISTAQHSPSDPSVEIAERAMREAIFDARLEPDNLPLFLGTSKGAIAALARAFDAAKPDTPHPQHASLDPGIAAPVALGPHGYLAQQLRNRLNLATAHHTAAACASSLHALHTARHHLLHHARDGDCAVVATADAALLPGLVHSYRRLGVLAPLEPARYRQHPLNQQRGGFMLTEGGAALVLRRLPADAPPEPGQIELLDTATAAEAYDLIRPAPDMPALEHLARQLMRQRRVDLIHPHAPGTADHDAAELNAYRRALDNRPATSERPDLYACKGALGHALGAAGLCAFVLACQTLMTGKRPPMPWIDQPIPESQTGFAIHPDARPCARTGTHAIFAAGFGGHLAGAVVQRY